MVKKFVADPLDGQKTVHYKRIMNAIENGEYCLFRQLITPMTADSTEVEYYEILVRLRETDKILLLPAEFFPVAQILDKYLSINGHMLHLDRWVVKHITEWTSRQNSLDKKQNNSLFFINITDDSIGDPGFPEFLRETLQDHDVPGTALCFEIPAVGLVLRNAEIAGFVNKVKKLGCRVAISGFGQDRVLFDLMQGIEVDFLKIDGSIIRSILDDTTGFTTVTAINKEARKFSVKTIAESVENEESIIKLQEIGINFVQGYGISRPDPLTKKPPKTYWKNKAAQERPSSTH